MRLFTVYALTEPKSGAVRYIGCSLDVIARVRSHFSEINSCVTANLPKSNWIRGLLRRGLQPGCRVLEEHIPVAATADAESFWMQYFRSRGVKLLNLKPGTGSFVLCVGCSKQDRDGQHRCRQRINRVRRFALS